MKVAELKTRVEKGLGPGRAFRDWGRRVDYRARGKSKESVRSWDGFKLEGRRNCLLRSSWDSSLARAFESKHGHLLLRGSSRSSIEEPGRVNSKVPYSGCKAEEEGEWAQPHQQPAFPTRKELKMKEESVCTIYGVE
ncbi:UNVERIFIED_CONTAM: hypothetical protein Scaly_2824300 [Sesamum calycinum]|uniref:Uncharacterized protein n=1 Tax=Sesamum calycinum TaxID=2727403 RepID=A0AAW2IS49_9LAMI